MTRGPYRICCDRERSKVQAGLPLAVQCRIAATFLAHGIVTGRPRRLFLGDSGRVEPGPEGTRQKFSGKTRRTVFHGLRRLLDRLDLNTEQPVKTRRLDFGANGGYVAHVYDDGAVILCLRMNA